MPLPRHDEHPTAMSRTNQPPPNAHRPAAAGILLMLALCILLGASTAVTGAATGMVLLLAVIFSELILASSRSLLSSALQAAAFVVIFAGCITAMDLLLRAWWPELYRQIGVFLPLAAAAGPLLASAKLLALTETRTETLKTAMTAGLAFAGAATVLGGLREAVASMGLLLARLPPGALIAAGVLLAMWNWFAERLRRS